MAHEVTQESISLNSTMNDPERTLELDNAVSWSLIDWLHRQREPLQAIIHKAMMDMIYSNSAFMRPALIKQLATVEIDAILNFVTTQDRSNIEAFGLKRAKEGLGASVLLTILRCVTNYCHQNLRDEQLIQASSVLGAYSDLYLDAYIRSRETVILAEQEHIRSALQGSFNRYYLWLQTAAEVSKAVTSTLDLRQLITEAVSLIRSHFDHNHVALYLLDSSRKYAVLRTSSGRDGQQIAREGQKVRVDEKTLVGRCAALGEARTITNTQTDALRSDKTLLPETMSVMLLPLISRRRIIGVISIQSIHSSAFYDDDVTRLQTIADQLANAIENARLYHELQIHSQNLAQTVELRTLELEKTTERVEAILNNSPDAILLLDKDLTIELANPAAYEMFGYEANTIPFVSLWTLMVEADGETLGKLLEECTQNGQARSFGIAARRSDESTFDAGVALASVFEDNAVTGLVCIVRDITEQVQAEEQIKASLREKEVLLQEIHHRVKNNMQVISSLIALQAGYTDDEQVHQMFRESQSRIRSMALVHEQLYRSHDLARIDFSRYIGELTSNLMHSYQKTLGRIRLDVHSDPVFLDIDTAIPCGLIINELVSNALKHAFPNGREGIITVEFHLNSEQSLTLIVRDDGVGLPEELNVHRTETLGLQLVTSLTAQINATIGLQQVHGTMFEIRFAAPEKSTSDVRQITRSGTSTPSLA
jgi:two-component system, sensor histidine kinase PdtaS